MIQKQEQSLHNFLIFNYLLIYYTNPKVTVNVLNLIYVRIKKMYKTKK